MRDGGIKTLASIVHLVLMTSVPAFIIEQLNIIKKFYFTRKKNKIKHSTLRSTYKLGGFKDTGIFYKITSLQCSWVRRLFDENFHWWNVISLYLIQKVFGANFKFHGNLDISKCPLKNFSIVLPKNIKGMD